ncbi:hypothetical protein EBT25_01860 [bacterium]|jgi:hypothetical protein|nr:hypothetical protein [bacterium]
MANENSRSSERDITMRAARVLIARYRRQRERAIGLADQRYQLRMRALWESLIHHTSMSGYETEILAMLNEELAYIPVAEVDPSPPAIVNGVQIQQNGRRRPLADITNAINNRNNRGRQ